MRIDYRRRKISLLTNHGKELIIAPVLERALGCQVEQVQGCDTDQFGSFDRITPRQGSQLQTARRKAQFAIDLSPHIVGIASEGSFTVDPFSGFMPWNIEMVLFLDDLHGLEVVGMAQGSAMNMSKSVRDFDSLMEFAADAGFPGHHLMLRPQNASDPRVTKGIQDVDTLKSAFIEALLQSGNGKVFVENDLRAFCNPTRRLMIEQATEDLARKLLSLCPECQIPGFWKMKTESGLPCGGCGSPTREAVCELRQCTHCNYSSHKTLAQTLEADPQVCDNCNP